MPERFSPAAVPPQVRDRPGFRPSRAMYVRGNRRPSANPAGPRYDSPADAHNLERLSQLRPRQHPCRARAGDGTGRAPVGRVLSDAAPRVPDADQAEALVPGARPGGRRRRARRGFGGREGPVRARRGRRSRGDRAARHVAQRSRSAGSCKLEEVDPIYFDRTYFLVPAAAEAQRRPYVLLLEAMKASGCRRARQVRARRQGEALPDPADGRRARARDALRRART